MNEASTEAPTSEAETSSAIRRSGPAPWLEHSTAAIFWGERKDRERTRGGERDAIK
jgi:hypothetical protein